MAKGKRSVALFEVIQSSKSAHKGALLKTPQWWFKRRDQMDAHNTAAPAPAAAAGSPPPGDPHSTAPAPRSTGVDLKLDPDRQRITFQLTYTSAAVAVFAVVIVLGLALIIGQRMSRGPVPVMAGATTEQLRSGSAVPGVLNVRSGARRQACCGGVIRRPAPKPVAASPEQITALAAPTTGPSGGRVLGFNYVLVQSYSDQKQLAQEACDFLGKNGIPCTVESDVQGWKGLYCVVGQRGFPRASGQDFDAYVKAIRDLSDPFAKNSKWKRFNPMAINGKVLKIEG